MILSRHSSPRNWVSFFSFVAVLLITGMAYLLMYFLALKDINDFKERVIEAKKISRQHTVYLNQFLNCYDQLFVSAGSCSDLLRRLHHDDPTLIEVLDDAGMVHCWMISHDCWMVKNH